MKIMINMNILSRSLKFSVNSTTRVLKYTLGFRYSSSTNILKSPYPDVVLPNIPLHEYIWKDINKWPNKIAIECGVTGKKYSFNELYLKSRRFAECLRKLGLKRGDTIGIFLPNCVEYPVVLLGALHYNLKITTINPNYTKEEVTYQLTGSNPQCIICHDTNLKVLLEAKNQLKNNFHIICTHSTSRNSPGSDNNVILFEELIQDSIDITQDTNNIQYTDPLDTLLILYSSGTTGLPKGTCLTQKSITSNMAQLWKTPVDKFIETTSSHQDVIPAVLPFFHIYGLIYILLQSIQKGARVVTLPRFDPKLYLDVIQNNQNVLQLVVPPIVLFLGNHEDVKAKHLRTTRELLTAAAPCSSHDIDKVKQKSNSDILFSQAYGLTEASPCVSFYTPNGVNDNHVTIGKMISNTWSKVIDLKTGQPLPHNNTGEICIKGPQLMKCYLNNAKATSEAIDSDGWLHTGDIGYYDEEGYFYLTDRLKEMFKVKGYQVAPSELEEVLRKHPAVLEAGVVGIPNERTGETPAAFVKTIPGAKVTEEEIKIFLASKLSKHKHLSSVKFIQDIPKTPSGKILRRDLKKLAMS